MTRAPYTTPPATMGKVTFEVEACGRCGGTGHYSFNMIHGSVCYGCNGAKRVRTAAAKRAAKKLDALKPELRADELVPGDQILNRDYTGRNRWHTVLEVEPDALNEGRTKIRWVAAGREETYGAYSHTMLRRAQTETEYAAYLEVARGLAGCNVVEADA